MFPVTPRDVDLAIVNHLRIALYQVLGQQPAPEAFVALISVLIEQTSQRTWVWEEIVPKIEEVSQFTAAIVTVGSVAS